MHLARAAARRRFWILTCVGVALFGLGITAARADEPAISRARATTEREGAMIERLRDCVTFERVQGEAFAVNPSSL